jgi:chemotaxis protein CheC
MQRTYSEMELSAIGEIVNIGTGNAATSLSQLVQREILLAVPEVEIAAIWDAAEHIGPIETPVTAILTPIGDDDAVAIALVFPEEAAETLCRLLGTEHGTELGRSALQEIGNILTGSYLTAMALATGIVLEPRPPVFARDMLGSVVDAIIAQAAAGSDSVVLLRAAISISNEECDFGLLFLPQPGALETLLQALGVA